MKMVHKFEQNKIKAQIDENKEQATKTEAKA